jgi:Uma2 family endonuclease
MSTAPRYEPRYSIADYEQWDGDWELWNGIAVSMSPSAVPEHQVIASRLLILIGSQLDNEEVCRQCVVVGELDWKADFNTVVRPDVLVTCDPLPPKRILAPPVFIAEVLSPSTAHKDRTAKRELYQAFKVPAYLMIDPANRSLEFLRLGSDGVYKAEALENQTMALQLTDQCSIQVSLETLFPS